MRYDVTIGIPTYRVESFIKRTLESALGQDYPSIEFLVIDDGSDDNTLEIVKGIKAMHPRGKDIRILTHDHNMGVSETRNHILEEAQGTYLYFVDSDDIIVPNTISLLMNELIANRADAVFGSYERIDLSGERELFQYPRVKFEIPDAFADYVYHKYARFQASACNYLFNLSMVRENGLRFFKSDFWEDMVFTLNLATIFQRVVLLPDITYSYLCRENSLSNSMQDVIEKERIDQYFSAVNTLKVDKQKLIGKSYYPGRCYFAIMSDIYIICNVMKKWEHIHPSFSRKELCLNMSHPATFKEIWRFKNKRLQNLLFRVLALLPSSLCLFLVRCFARIKGLL